MLFRVSINFMFLLVWEASADLPSYFPRCDLDDPDLNRCIAVAAETLRSHIQKGINEIEFPSLDPLVISALSVTQESDKVNYTISVWNYTIWGLDNYNLTEVRYDPNTKTFEGKFRFNTVPVDTDYKMNGSVLTFPVVGSGKVEVRFVGVDGKYKINGELVNRKGTEYYRPTNAKIRMAGEDVYFHFRGLFDGNIELERLTNELLNKNSKMILDAVTSVFEKQAEAGIMYMLKSLTKRVPYYKLFHRS